MKENKTRKTETPMINVYFCTFVLLLHRELGGYILSGPVLRDTARLSQRYPLLRAMGFLVSQRGQFGAIPPPLF